MYVIILSLLATYVAAQPICPDCDKFGCIEQRHCKNGLVLDPCGCCKVCSRVEGEVCGGLNSMQGLCQKGFVCHVRHPKSLSNQMRPPFARLGKCEPDGCELLKCGMHQWCTLKNNKTECVCPVHCKAKEDPVCGLVDGRNYKNSCIIRKKECKLQKRIGWMPGKCKRCVGEDKQQYKYGEVIDGKRPCETCECRHGNWICKISIDCLKKTLYKGYSCTGDTYLHSTIKCQEGFQCIIKKPADNITGAPALGNCVQHSAFCTISGKKFKSEESFIHPDCGGYCRCHVGPNGNFGISCVSLCPPTYVRCPVGQVERYFETVVSIKSNCTCKRPKCVNDVPSCTIDKDNGPCYGYMENWYFNSKTGRCQLFIYGGCLGNDNRFETRKLCENHCLDLKSIIPPTPEVIPSVEPPPPEVIPPMPEVVPPMPEVKPPMPEVKPPMPEVKPPMPEVVPEVIPSAEIPPMPAQIKGAEKFAIEVSAKEVSEEKKEVIKSIPKAEPGRPPSGRVGPPASMLTDEIELPPADQLTPPDEEEEPFTWPDASGPIEDIKLSNKSMTIHGSIKFNRIPPRFPKPSCLRIKFEDHSIADGASFVFAEKEIGLSNVSVADKPITYSIDTKMLASNELWRTVSMAAVLNVGWCPTKESPKWIRNKDYLTDTSHPVMLMESKFDYPVDIDLVYYCAGSKDCESTNEPSKIEKKRAEGKPKLSFDEIHVPEIKPPTCGVDKSTNETRKDGDKWDADECTSCICSKSGAICKTYTCIAPCQNPVKVPGKCCPVCPKNCKDDETGKTYGVGESWFGSDDCKMCTCGEFGQQMCVTPMCALPYCPLGRPLKTKGRCCPVCPTDEFCVDETDGRGYKLGTETWQRKTCEVCRCTKNGINCVDPTKVNNTCAYPRVHKRNCKPICIPQPKRDYDSEPSGCIDKTDFGRPLGSIWHPDNCTTCKCEKEHGITCSVVDCLPTNDCEEVIRVPGRCCPICKKQKEKSCEYREKKYFEGDYISLRDRCTICNCKSGRWACDEKLCNTINKKDKDCEYKEKAYKAGAMVKQDCNTCICGKNGNFACTEMFCDLKPIVEP